MPWLPIYAAPQDLSEVFAFLDQSSELAFIISDGSGRWRATSVVERVSTPQPKRYCLWHVPSGPLPLLRADDREPGSIVDPFGGWQEERGGADPACPFFGAGHPGVIWLNVSPDNLDTVSQIRAMGLSSFEWIGNRYRIIGFPALAVTERFWKSLRQWVQQRASKVPRGGPTRPTPPEIWAFRHARELFSQGAVGAINP